MNQNVKNLTKRMKKLFKLEHLWMMDVLFVTETISHTRIYVYSVPIVKCSFIKNVSANAPPTSDMK
jgi:hypothetical protein